MVKHTSMPVIRYPPFVACRCAGISCRAFSQGSLPGAL